MKKIIDHKHIPIRKYNNCLCLICGAMINSVLISQKSNENLYEIENYPIELFHNLLAEVTKRKFSQYSRPYNHKRKALIDKLIQIKRKLRLSDKIFHLTVYLTDMVIDHPKGLKYEHIGLGCLLLAVKYLQNEDEIPDMKQFEMRLNDIFYSIEELKRYEVHCIQQVKYKLNVVTPVDFIEYFNAKGLLFSNELTQIVHSVSNSIIISTKLNANSILTTIYEILLKVINRLSYSSISSFHIACSCLCLAREIHGIKQKWSSTFASVYKTQFAEFESVYDLIRTLYNETQKTPSVYSKVIIPSRIANNEENMKSGDFFLKKRKPRTLSLGASSSFLNQYIKHNLESFNNKERGKQHSNESSCKKETAQSINATPENIPIIPVRKYKCQNMNLPIRSNNITVFNSKIPMIHNPKLQDYFESTMLNTNITDKKIESKNSAQRIFKGCKIKSNKELRNNSIVGTSGQLLNLKHVIHSYNKSKNRKLHAFSGSKNLMPPTLN